MNQRLHSILSSGFQTARRPLVVAGFVFLAAATGSAVLIWRLHEHRLREERARVADLVFAQAQDLQLAIERSLSATYALAALVRHGNGEVPAFEAFAGEMLPYYPGVTELALSPGGVIRQVFPLAGNEKALGLDQLKDPVQSKEAFLARDSRRLTLAGPLELIQGGLGAIGRLPVFLDRGPGESTFWGFTNVVIRFPDVLDAVRFSDFAGHGFAYELWRVVPDTGKKQIIATTPAGPPIQPVARNLVLPNGTWTLSAAPLRGWGNPTALAFSTALGFVFSSLLAFMAKLLVELQQHQQGLATLVTQRTAELRSREADLNRAQSVARVGSWIFDVARHAARRADAVQWSAETYRLFGAPPGVPQSLANLLPRVHLDDRAVVRRAWKSLLSGARDDFEFRILVGGEVRWLRTRAESETDAVGGRRYVGTVQDITERKAAEEALRESEQRFRSVLETMSLVGVILDRAGHITLCNDHLLRLTGWRREEVLQRDWFELFLPPDVRPGVESEVFLRAIATGEVPAHYENEIVTRTGERRLIAWNNTLIRSATGAVTDIAAIGEDITNRRNLETQLRQSQKMEVVGRLAGGVAHDFNNILTAMMLNLELLRDTALPPSVHASLGELGSMTARAARLTQQLLLFARKQPMSVEAVEINGALASLLVLLRRLLGEHIELTLEPASEPLWIEADPGMLDQAVMNLCVNARDAMPGGGRLTLTSRLVDLDKESARAMADARPGRFVCLVISDTGCGMTPETLAHLFEPFFTTKEIGKGTGLGLASVHGIVHQSNGWIGVESAPGRGSTFRLFFPVLSKATAPASTATTVAPRPQGSETILLVEDESVVRQIAATMLQRLGYRVLVATDGQHALALWANHSAEIDLLLTDMVMPGGFSGLQLVEKLRQSKPALRIILMSGYSSTIVEGNTGDRDDFAFLAKPFGSTALAATVRRCLDTPPAPSREPAGPPGSSGG